MIIHKSFGLDLGTTNSTASVVKNGKIVFAEEGRAKVKTIPSIVAVKPTGDEIVGSNAKLEWGRGNPSKKSVKREMGKQVTFPIGKNDYSPEEISSKIINYCKECLISTLGKDNNVLYDKIVVTVPAYFSLAQKDATRKAAELAGLEVQMLLEEPTAAAINYAVQNNIEDGLFFVFDLGGGTFDVSILEKTGNIPSVLAIAGNLYLGGDNFDFILARYFLDYLKESGFDVDDVEVDADDNKFRQLLLAAENVKKQLSIDETYSVYFPDVFKDNSCVDLTIEEFSREQFNNLIKEKVEVDIINECEKALTILKEKSGKTLNDITHIIMVGGSTKIPYVKETIKKKYCVTDKLKDITIFEPDLSVSAGAAFIANSDGLTLEDEEHETLVKVNAPYVIDSKIYITGNLIKGKATGIIIKDKKSEVKTTFQDDNSFTIIEDAYRFSDSFSYLLKFEDDVVSDTVDDDNSVVDIIAPTPVQNEDIAIEIIDIEKGKIEKFVILASGTYLPSNTTEFFKINEYSKKQVILPVWEGPRKIFNFVIDLPNNVKIGSKLAVTTSVDLISNVTLDVELDGKKLEGRYEYIEQEDINEQQVEELQEQFNKRINFVEDEGKKEELMTARADLERELEEAKNNNDENHYSSVSQKYEKVVAEMPASPALTEAQFDQIGEYIKGKLTSDVKYSNFDVDNLVFYGKRFIKRDNLAEAQKCMDELIQIKNTVDLFNSPESFYQMCKITVLQILAFAVKYVESPTADRNIVDSINREYNKIHEEVETLLKKYDDGHTSPEMKEDGKKLLQLTSGIYQVVQAVMPSDDASISAYRGLVSKA